MLVFMSIPQFTNSPCIPCTTQSKPLRRRLATLGSTREFRSWWILTLLSRPRMAYLSLRPRLMFLAESTFPWDVRRTHHTLSHLGNQIHAIEILTTRGSAGPTLSLQPCPFFHQVLCCFRFFDFARAINTITTCQLDVVSLDRPTRLCELRK